MAEIKEYHGEYWLVVDGDRHLYADITIWPMDGGPAITFQKADAIVRKMNPNLRLIDKWVSIRWYDCSAISWTRRYAVL